MELHPILEEDVTPNRNLWYVVSAFGDRPSLRVGHTAISKHSGDKTEQVIIIGGANPSECFSDIHILDMTSLSWNILTPPLFTSRYEHVSYIPSSQRDNVYVLAGANQESNISDAYVQCYDMQNEKWSVVKTSGTAPSPRTHHTTATIKDCAYFFSGGKNGADPVQDRQVYSFNASSNVWTALSITGSSPSPRHGHTLSVIANRIYCFGGMAGTKFYNDVHILDVEKGMWLSQKIKKRNLPEPRAAHAAVSVGMDIYVFGGLSKDGVALDDLWKLDTVTMQWSQCQYEGPPPACRLDMACCVISWPVNPPEVEDSTEALAAALDRVDLGTPEGTSKDPSQHPLSGACALSTCKLLLIHGGTDTQGEIFDDCLVYRLD